MVVLVDPDLLQQDRVIQLDQLTSRLRYSLTEFLQLLLSRCSALLFLEDALRCLALFGDVPCRFVGHPELPAKGAGGHDGCGCHPCGGTQPGSGNGHPGGAANRKPFTGNAP